MKQVSNTLIVSICLVASMLGQSPSGRVYKNENYNFCIDVPSGWQGGEPFDRNGVVLTPINAGSYVRRPQIAVSARPDQPSEEDDQRPQTLEEILDSRIRGLRDYASAKDLRILAGHGTQICGLRARMVTLEYTDSEYDEEWFEENLTVIDRRQVVYSLDLTCHPRDSAKLSRVWQAVVKTLRVDCDNHPGTEKGGNNSH